MKPLAILLMSLTSCTTFGSYDSVKIYAGIQIPIPVYEINIGFMIDLKDKAVLEQELRRTVEEVNAYAHFEAWLRKREEDENSGQ